MGNKSKKRSNSEHERSHLLKKIRKLEKRVRNLDPENESEVNDITPTNFSTDVIINNKENIPLECVEVAQSENETENDEILNEIVESEPAIEDMLEDNILEILGAAHQSQKRGKNLHNQIAERWAIIIKKGLDKEEKENIEKENPVFDNFVQMIPPKLNPEVNAAINDISRKRDQLIQKRQQQIATALTCLGSGLQLCVSDIQDHKMEIIKKLNEASRLLCDSLCVDTKGRRSLLLAGINKDMKEFLIQSEPDTYLFGDNLTEKIKTVKSVQKSGKELKVVTNTKQPVPRQSATVKTTANNKNKALNWRGPPRPDMRKRPQQGRPVSRPTVDKRKDERNYQRRQK